VVLSEDKAKFRSGHAVLTAEAKTELDGLVQTVQQEARQVFIEIEGHTDSVGSATYNERLGLQRAEAVKRYLYEQHQIPLHKMNVISFGETKPVAPNKTRDGRSQNRRVVVKVLA
jgi:outer membrane protein OmpA-like peptidoglycan-associated protein